MKPRVLVTGAKGFIGSHILQTLTERGYTVRGYDRLDGEDILDKEQLDKVVFAFGPQVIIHLAGQVFLQPSITYPEKDALINIIGTINVLEIARSYNCTVIFSSSGAVYGSNDRSHISETHDPEPISPYGLSKLTAERYCLLYNSLYGVHVVIFRFSSVYGQGRKKTSVNLILDKALKNEVITVTGNGEQTRDFTHVDDVCEAIVMAVEGKFPVGIYNIGTGESTSINSLIQIIEELLGKKLSVEYVHKSKGDPLRNDFNVSKAEQYGFKTKVKIKEGLKKLIEGYENPKF